MSCYLVCSFVLCWLCVLCVATVVLRIFVHCAVSFPIVSILLITKITLPQ